MSDIYPVFVNLRFVITENIDSNVYKVLQYLTEWPMIVGEKPEIYDNDFFRNDDWSNFFANNGIVTLGNFMAYEDMGIEKIFSVSSYVPSNRRNTVYNFIKWLKSCLEFDRPEAMIGYLDHGGSIEVITSVKALPVNFTVPENTSENSEE
jgi:hypothetical protein